MTPLVILVCAIVLTFGVLVAGAWAGRTKNQNLEGWLVHHRGMGSVLLWFLLGSEIYTAFTFQGLAGYSYSKGAAGFYNVAQNDVAYAIAFLVLPCIWMLGKRFGYVTQADFVAHRYGSKALGVFVALSTALIMIAYIDLNIEGLSAIFRILGGGAISPVLGNVIAFVVLACAVFIGGIRGNAIQSVIKDLLMFAAVGALFVAVPMTFFHGFGDMYSSFVQKIPGYFQLPSAKAPELGPVWLFSTVLVTGVGQWMWPQWFGTAFTASSPTALKRQAVLMPFYQIVKVAVLTVGFAAIIALGTGLVGNDVVMRMMRDIFPGWALVLMAIAAMLSAIVPAGPIVMTSASLLSRNVVHALKPELSERRIFWLTRMLVFPLVGAALVLTLVAPALIVSVLLVAYAFITQLFPGIVVGGIFWKRATKEGMLAGLLVGWAVTAVLLLSGHDPLFGVNAGLIALVANLIVFVVVSLCTTPSPTGQSVGTILRDIAAESGPGKRKTREAAPAVDD